uniref:Uncharacterized protein n=1 Tax=Laticauda laticaudata TaxID=8630 RepID=A0A8C5SG73_LATLA
MASPSPFRKRKELGNGEGAGEESPGLGPVSGGVRMASARRGSACLQAAGSGERALGELLLEFSRAQYRARESGGAAGGSTASSGNNKVEHIEKCCLELFSKDYCYSLIHNVNGEICSHYPRLMVILEYESSDREKHTGPVDNVTSHVFTTWKQHLYFP